MELADTGGSCPLLSSFFLVFSPSNALSSKYFHSGTCSVIAVCLARLVPVRYLLSGGGQEAIPLAHQVRLPAAA